MKRLTLLVSLVLAVVSADYSSSPGSGSFGVRSPSYLVKNAGRSHQYSWIGSGHFTPRRVPRPPQLPRFIWMGRPMYSAVWVPKLPTAGSSGYGAPKPPGSSHGGVTVIGGGFPQHQQQQPSQAYSAEPAISSSFSTHHSAANSEYQASSAPVNQYSIPQTSVSYEVPQQQQVEQSYSAPAQQQYSAPQQTFAESAQNQGGYDAPEQIQESYAAPQKEQGSYEAPQQPQENYGAPVQPEVNYGAPQQPEENYGAHQQPEEDYGAPQQPEENYGAPEQPEENYGAPRQPEEDYGAPPGAQEVYTAPQSPQGNYGTPQQSQNNFAPPQQPQNQYGSVKQTRPDYETPIALQNVYSRPESSAVFSPLSVSPSQNNFNSPSDSQYTKNSPVPSNNEYGPPKPDDHLNNPVDSSNGYISPEKSQNNYGNFGQSLNNFAAPSQSLQPLQNYESSQSIQSDYTSQPSNDVGNIDYGAPKQASLIDFSSAQRYETVDITPLTSPISTQTTLDPSSYGRPKQDSILGVNGAFVNDLDDSFASQSQHTVEKTVSPLVENNEYGVPKTDSLISNSQQLLEQVLPAKNQETIINDDSISTSGGNYNQNGAQIQTSFQDYSNPDQRSIIKSESAENLFQPNEANSESDAQTTSYQLQTGGYSNLDPDSIITIDSLKEQDGQKYNSDVFVNIRGSFNYDNQQQQQQQQGLQGYGAVQSEDIVDEGYQPGASLEVDNNVDDSRYTNLNTEFGTQQPASYYDVQYPQASQYQEEFYRPNEIESVDDSVNTVPLSLELENNSESAIENEINDIKSVFIYYPEKNELINTSFDSDGGVQTVIAEFDDQEGIALETTTGSPPSVIDLQPETTVQVESDNETENGTTETEQFTSTENAITTTQTSTENTSVSLKRKRRPLHNLPTRRPYYSSFHVRRRKYRKSQATKTTEITPDATTTALTATVKEQPQLESDIESTIAESASNVKENQLDAIKIRLEEIRNRRQRPIPFGARLRPKISRISNEESED